MQALELMYDSKANPLNLVRNTKEILSPFKNIRKLKVVDFNHVNSRSGTINSCFDGINNSNAMAITSFHYMTSVCDFEKFISRIQNLINLESLTILSDKIKSC